MMPQAQMPRPTAPPSENLAVSGLPPDITDDKVRSTLGQYGLVAQVKVLPPLPGRQDREAFVRMSKLDDAKWIVANVNDNVLDGMADRVTVQYSLHKGPLSPWGGLPMSSTGVMLAPTPRAVIPPALPSIPLGVTLSGTVRRWDANKGFGFIGPDAGGPDVFVHVRELSDGELLVQGSKVLFEATLDQARGPGKYRAKMCVGAKPKAPGPSDVVSEKLFVSQLPADTTEEMVSSVFSQYGLLTSAKLLPLQPGSSDLSAVVHMDDVNMAKWLVENVNGNIPVGMSTPVSISFASDPPLSPALVPPGNTAVHTPVNIAQALMTAASSYGKAGGAALRAPLAGPYDAPAGAMGGKGQGQW